MLVISIVGREDISFFEADFARFFFETAYEWLSGKDKQVRTLLQNNKVT